MFACRDVWIASTNGLPRAGPRSSSASTAAVNASCSLSESVRHHSSNCTVYSTSYIRVHNPYHIQAHGYVKRSFLRDQPVEMNDRLLFEIVTQRRGNGGVVILALSVGWIATQIATRTATEMHGRLLLSDLIQIGAHFQRVAVCGYSEIPRNSPVSRTPSLSCVKRSDRLLHLALNGLAPFKTASDRFWPKRRVVLARSDFAPGCWLRSFLRWLVSWMTWPRPAAIIDPHTYLTLR